MIKALLFDLDGTMLDRDASVQKFIGNQYERFKKWTGHIPKEIYISRFIELDSRDYVWKDRVYKELISELYINNIKWELLLEDYLGNFKNHCVPFPNIISMLEVLKKRRIKLGIITNGKGQFQLDNIRALGIEKFFDTILISEWEGIKKPDPEIFYRALRKLKVLPQESIYVGDHPENDVQAARNLGMKAIWKKDTQLNEVETDYMIEDLLEIPIIIDNINNER
ncbi:HAD family hydrolase [Neobacillus rhizophilus]|uniref:HAD family hydrolase n=1 Tax=Neobacillus rhizophilus TaxID=2833579 RepID=A0A942TZ60_9BACI|nr:HAD family hydrolase [Neobacillus rhizophilus]MBS4211506.1 HAD family hydrolase [Neobacillus rhizophilus]